MTRILFTFALFIMISNKPLVANTEDPFTRSLGDGSELVKEVEKETEETVGTTENTNPQTVDPVTQVQAPQPQMQQPVMQTSSDKIDPIGNILAPDPLIAYELIDYTLKGTALNTTGNLDMVAFNREGSAQKVDYGNIKTTHIVNQNDTIESIARQYGYAPEELKIANSIIPGSKLIMGTRITLPARVHKVQKGQSLEMISEIYNLDL